MEAPSVTLLVRFMGALEVGKAVEVKLPDQPPPTLGQVLQAVFARYPAVKCRVLDEHDRLRRDVNVFIGRAKVKRLGLDTPVDPGVEIWVMSAVSGG